MSWQSVTSPRLSSANELAYDSTNWVYTATQAEFKQPRNTPIKNLPFEVISASGDLLKAAAGLLGGVNIDPPEQKNPANGTWNLLAKVIINSSSGAITSSTVKWTKGDVPSDTTSTYYLAIARVDLINGAADPDNSFQYTFGPISVVVGGGRDSRYAARLL